MKMGTLEDCRESSSLNDGSEFGIYRCKCSSAIESVGARCFEVELCQELGLT